MIVEMPAHPAYIVHGFTGVKAYFCVLVSHAAEHRPHQGLKNILVVLEGVGKHASTADE